MLHSSGRICRHVIGRRCYSRSLQVRAAHSPTSSSSGRKNLVFLGTPEVAAIVLDALLTAAEEEGSSFQVAAVVSQPGKPKGRGNKAVPVPSPVEEVARRRGLPDERILCPASAKDPAFLEALAALKPDLCVTAAYGNMLPKAFLATPLHGTLNIHPSLLPAYRGAAPVQRALEDGVPETGVSVAFTVLKCDAGPILAQQRVPLTGEEQAPALLEHCFRLGAQLLLEALPKVWTGEATHLAWTQDESAATHAAKLTKEEDGLLDPSRCRAQVLHNKVRACAGWPGTVLPVVLVSPDETSTTTSTSSSGSDGGSSSGSSSDGGKSSSSSSSSSGGGGKSSSSSGSSGSSKKAGSSQMALKVLRSRVVPAEEVGSWLMAEAAAAAAGGGRLVWAPGNKRLLVSCLDGTLLELLEVQPPTKKAMAPVALYNGLGGRQLVLDSHALASHNHQQQQQQMSSVGKQQPSGLQERPTAAAVQP